MSVKISYSFTAEMWKHSSPGGWYFISLPEFISKEIREHLGWQEEGWGRMKVIAKINQIEWETAIWFDTKRETYLLPVKADVRKKTNIKINEKVEVIIRI